MRVGQWGEIDVKRFVRRMHGDDIHVTNRSGKVGQLQSLENLSHLLRHLGFGESAINNCSDAYDTMVC